MPAALLRTAAALLRTAAVLRTAAALAACALALTTPAALAAATFGPLPATGTSLAQDAGSPDATAGALRSTAARAPWVAFVQSPGAAAPTVQVDAFQRGAWQSIGQPAALNFDPNAPARGPAIAFAGLARTVPWVTWFELDPVFDGPTHPTQVLAARFAASAAAPGGGRWTPEGQDRTGGVPALNVHPDRTAADPAIAAGPPSPDADPLPWVAWRERDGAAADTGPFQLFVAHAVRNATAQQPCPQDSGTSVGIFCWLRDGAGRIAPDDPKAPGPDPSLNVDPTRSTTAPDIAFAGGATPTPWVVWQETGPSGHPGLSTQNLVFAAHGHPDPLNDASTWSVVSANTGGEIPLDTAGTNQAGQCSQNLGFERTCALNADPTAPAAAPAIAAGTMSPGSDTAPWVAWQEQVGGGPYHAIFVARLNGVSFTVLNDGKPISPAGRDATLPAIAFSGHTPYVAWREQSAGVTRIAVGHFGGDPADPAFVTDSDPTSGAFAGSTGGEAPVLATACAPAPGTLDPDFCPAGAAGTPFAVLGDTASLEDLFAVAPDPVAPTTRPPSAITGDGGTLEAGVAAAGAPQLVRFQYGRTTAYGATTRARRVGPQAGAVRVSVGISHFAPGTTIHYRAIGASDFGTAVGGDQAFTTTAPPRRPPPLRVSFKLVSRKLRDVVRRRRLRIRVQMSQPGRIVLTARTRTVKGRTVPLAHRTARLRRRGSITLSPRISPAAPGILKALRRPRLTITIRGAATNRTTRRISRAVVLR